MNDASARRLRHAFAAALACGLAAGSAIAAPPRPPPPRIEAVIDTVHGVRIADPYRWMEAGGADFDAWTRAEAAHARGVLDAIDGRAALGERIRGLDRPGRAIQDLQVRGDRWLYRRATADGTLQLLVRDGAQGAERVVDLMAALPAGDGPWSEVAAARVLSPDGRHLAFGTTQKGEEFPTLRVYDIVADRLLPDAIRWPLWADSNGFRPRWLADGSGFLYVRRPDASDAMDNTARARRGQVFVHRLGTPVADDRALFGHGLTAGIDEADTLYVNGEPHPRWLSIWRRKPSGLELWVVDLAAAGGTAPPPSRRVWSSDIRVPGYGVRGDFLYTADAAGSPRFRVVRYDLREAAPQPQVVLPQQEGVLTQLAVAADGVYAVESLLSQARLHVIDDTGTRAVALPAGVVESLDVGVEGSGAWLSQVDWLSPRRGWLVEPGAQAPRASALDAGNAAAPVAARTELRWATARDGERIPYTLVRAAGARDDGGAFVMMDGYGCFGVNNTPFYWPSLQAWLERGGAFVRVALRGGGELGADWHRAGRDRNKPAAFEDAIDVAKDLVRTGITRPGRIGATGGSCGGMTMGMAALEAPHLVGAAVLSVGAFDQLRMADRSAAGARSIRDIGDPATADGVRRITALSPYQQVLDGARRPAFLIGSGATDYTIPLWVGGKFVARLNAAAPDGPPVLWDIKWEGGHNAGVDYVQLDTDQFAFLFWQLGHPDFQPRAAAR